MNTVWVSCEGENPADQENIGPVDYLPIRGFPGYFYPYQNSEGYLSPLVAVHFQRPKRKFLLEFSWLSLKEVNFCFLLLLIFQAVLLLISNAKPGLATLYTIARRD